MKIFLTRLNEAHELRKAALRILDRSGLDTIIYDRQKRRHTRQIEIGGLTIMHSSPESEQLLDICKIEKSLASRGMLREQCRL